MMDRFNIWLSDKSKVEVEARTPEAAREVVYAMMPGVTIDRVMPERKSLYTDDFRLTKDAITVQGIAASALEPIFDGLRDKGYSPREIAHVLQDVVRDLESESTIMGGN